MKVFLLRHSEYRISIRDWDIRYMVNVYYHLEGRKYKIISTYWLFVLRTQILHKQNNLDNLFIDSYPLDLYSTANTKPGSQLIIFQQKWFSNRIP